MRILHSDTLSAQNQRVRKPITSAVIYDTMLRWSSVSTYTDISGAFYDDYRCDLMDADIESNGIYVCWQGTHTPGTLPEQNVYYQRYNRQGQRLTNTALYGHTEDMRPSVHGHTAYYVASSGGTTYLRSYNGSATTNIATLPGPYVYAIAYNGSGYTYLAWVSSNNEIKLARVNNSNGSIAYCDYGISCNYEVDESNRSSNAIAWFSVAAAGDYDVVIVNSNEYGCPLCIQVRNGVWGTPRTIIPIDLVDNYSNLRIGWTKKSGGVFYATGELTRKGSSGLNPQRMGIVLRSRDGLSWTVDRYRYIGQSCRGPLLIEPSPSSVNGNKAYLWQGGTPASLKAAPLTPFFGLTDANAQSDNVRIEIGSDDIIEGSISEPNHGETGTLGMVLSDIDLRYSDPSSSMHIKPGYMLRLYAGYHTSTASSVNLIGTFGIDTVELATGDSVRVNGRSLVSKMLQTHVLDQDWQWLGNLHAYDDCDSITDMYTMGEGRVTVEYISSTSQKKTPTGRILLDSRNKVGVIAATSPFEIDNKGDIAIVVGGFGKDTSNYYICSASDYASGPVSVTSQIGVGTFVGPALIKDGNNFICAAYNPIDERIYLLRRKGDLFYFLAAHPFPNVEGAIATIRMCVANTEITYSILMFTQYSRIPVRFGSWKYNISLSGHNRLGIAYHITDPSMSIAGLRARSTTDDIWCRYFSRSLADYDTSWVPTITQAQLASSSLRMPTSPPLWLRSTVINHPRYGYIIDNSDQPIQIQTHAGHTSLGYVFKISNLILGSNNSFASVGYTGATMIDPFSILGRGTREPTMLHIYGEPGNGTPVDITYHDTANKMIRCPSFKLDYPGITFSDVSNTQAILAPAVVLKRPASTSYSTGAYARLHASDAKFWVQSIMTNDCNHILTTEDVLKDIAVRAGLMHFAGSTASCSTNTASIEEGIAYPPNRKWLSRTYKDVVIDLLSPGMSSAQIELSASSTDLFRTGLRIYITTLGAVASVSFMANKTDPQSGGPTNLTLAYMAITEFDVGSSFKKARISKRGPTVTVFLEDRYVASYTYGPIVGGSFDNFDASTLEKPGYIGISDPLGAISYRVSEMYTEIGTSYNASLLGRQGSTAAAMMDEVIRNRRIKVLSRSDGAVKISRYLSRDGPIDISDAVLSSTHARTDNISTHIRMIGEEIGEYIHHPNMEKYGVLFLVKRADWLTENEAYLEAEMIVNDEASFTRGMMVYMAPAMLQIEPEDIVQMDYTSVRGLSVKGTFIVTNSRISFGPARLEQALEIRRISE